MTKNIKTTTLGCMAALSLTAALSQVAAAAVFQFRIDNASAGPGDPAGDGANFQQVWGNPINWILVSGEDDGANGYPDGTDSIVMDRTTLVNNSTRLTEEGSPASLTSIASITGTGTGNQDIVLKLRAFSIGDLVCLASPNPFHLRAERDRAITITGVISGAGDLRISRNGGFSDGVTDDELITITGDSPNTIAGNIRLFNENNSAENPQPSFWVADKVGAFGQAPQLTLEGRPGNGGIASLQITANAVGGEGAIDDDATTFFIGAKGILNLDAGVNEVIGEGLLQIDLLGSGTYTTVPNGTYTNTEDWITGEGTITVGAPSAEFAITAIDYDPNDGALSLTWNSRPGQFYAVFFSTDLMDWGFDLDDEVAASAGETTTASFNLAEIPELDGVTKVFFRIEEVDR